MEDKLMKIWDVNVPRKLLTAKPKLYKIMGMEAYYKKYDHFYGSIIVDKHYNIIDGYVIYYVAKKNKIHDVPVRIVSTKDRIRHFWRKVVKKWNLK